MIKYKPVFKVEFLGEQIGYVSNKKTIDESIQDYIECKDNNIAFVEVEELPTYKFMFVDNSIQTNEEEVLLAVKDESIVTYCSYAIKLDGNLKEQVKTMEDAENVVNKIKEEYQQDLELDLVIEEIYTQENPNEAFVEKEIATADLGNILNEKIEEKKEAERIAEEERIAQEEKEKAKKAAKSYVSVDDTSDYSAEIKGISLTRPLSAGSISSRFGERSSRRSSSHTGLDIAAPYGTSIKPVAEGTVTFAGTKGSYGKLIIVSHGNGVTSYYAHCSALYVSEGDSVNTETVIAAVGSTGNSTGNHLHLELRINDNPVNPQKYLYN